MLATPASKLLTDFQSAMRHEGYTMSINARRGIVKMFGWIKQWGGLRQFKVRGSEKVRRCSACM